MLTVAPPVAGARRNETVPVYPPLGGRSCVVAEAEESANETEGDVVPLGTGGAAPRPPPPQEPSAGVNAIDATSNAVR
jgi:hypothetical protein